MPIASTYLAPGDFRRTLTIRGIERSYLVHVPAPMETGQRVPLVLAFHGGGSQAAQMVHFCGLNETADKHGFVVVYPDGTGRSEGKFTWNASASGGLAERSGIDDVAFVQALLDEVELIANVDRQRIYAAGMSLGAMMAYRLADELSERIAAIAAVGGPMGSERCAPARPVSIVHFHGTDDKFAPFGGGQGERSISRIHFFSVEHTIGNWVRANGCPPEPTVTRLDPRVDDGTQVTRSVYGPGREGSEVVLYRIDGAGHTWPGRKPPLLFLGKSTMNLTANDVIWEFFARHRRER